jgi:hypothetical protein
MLSFTQFIAESKENIGWWKDQDHLHVYHGTHDRNVEHIVKYGLTKKDPKTGFISVTHDPFTAHAYAAMSGSGGESNFRSSGKAVHTPHEERSVVHMKIPMSWAKENMDPHLSGNVGDAKDKLTDRSKYDTWRKDHPSLLDRHYYSMTEVRLKKEVPPEFIQGVLKKSGSTFKPLT